MRKYLKKAIAVGLTSFMLLNFSGYQEVFAENENIELSAYTPIQGEGTEISPYLVTDESQLVALANGELSKSAYYRLENNIKLRSYDWKPISNFSGVFDGNEHTITNLKIGELGSNYSYLGLFGKNSGTIKNLSVDINEIIGVTTTGGIVGYNSGTVDNCFTSGNIRAAGNYDYNYMGGIVGDNYKTVTNCYSDCKISGKADVIGGIVSYAHGEGISNCVFYGSLELEDCNYAGGIIGKIYSDDVNCCVSTGNLNISNSSGDCIYVGGIAGEGGGEKISNCYSKNIINVNSTYGCVGGIVGSYADIVNCYSDGQISVVNDSSVDCGGIAGVGGNAINSYSRVNITGEFEYVGGLFGYGSDTVEDCYYAGELNIESSDRAKAIVGYQNGTADYRNVFYDKTKVGDITDNYNIGLTTEEMKNKDSYLFWDFDTIWNIDKNYNDGYPYLRSLGINASGVKLDKTTLDIVKGESYKLNANVLPSNAVNSDVIWKSKDVFVATVDKSGNITAVAPGTTTIVAITKDGGYTSECTVNVLDNAVTISCGDISTMPGKVIKVPVSIENNKGISSFGINITYDKNYLTPVGISDGTFFSGNIANLTYSDNVIRVTNASATNKIGDGVLFYISFNVKENIADTNSEIAIAVDQVKTINGSNTFNVDYHQKNGTVAIKNAVLGDVDNDGQVTANDATQILMNYALLKEFDELQKVAGDIDGDGMVTANDATQALLKYAGFNVEW